MKRLLVCALLAFAAPAWALGTIIFADDAHGYVGKNVTVRGTVERIHHAGPNTLVYLNGHNARSAFVAVIGPGAADYYPEVDTYSGRSLDVSGVIVLERGTPEILVKTGQQIYLK